LESFEGISDLEEFRQHQGILFLTGWFSTWLVSSFDTQEVFMFVQIDINQFGTILQNEFSVSACIKFFIEMDM